MPNDSTQVTDGEEIQLHKTRFSDEQDQHIHQEANLVDRVEISAAIIKTGGKTIYLKEAAVIHKHPI